MAKVRQCANAKCKSRLPDLGKDGHSLCSLCIGHVCLPERKCQQCSVWPEQQFKEYLRYRQRLEKSRTRKQRLRHKLKEMQVSKEANVSVDKPSDCSHDDRPNVIVGRQAHTISTSTESVSGRSASVNSALMIDDVSHDLLTSHTSSVSSPRPRPMPSTDDKSLTNSAHAPIRDQGTTSALSDNEFKSFLVSSITALREENTSLSKNVQLLMEERAARISNVHSASVVPPGQVPSSRPAVGTGRDPPDVDVLCVPATGGITLGGESSSVGPCPSALESAPDRSRKRTRQSKDAKSKRSRVGESSETLISRKRLPQHQSPVGESCVALTSRKSSPQQRSPDARDEVPPSGRLARDKDDVTSVRTSKDFQLPVSMHSREGGSPVPRSPPSRGYFHESMEDMLTVIAHKCSHLPLEERKKAMRDHLRKTDPLNLSYVSSRSSVRVGPEKMRGESVQHVPSKDARTRAQPSGEKVGKTRQQVHGSPPPSQVPGAVGRSFERTPPYPMIIENGGTLTTQSTSNDWMRYFRTVDFSQNRVAQHNLDMDKASARSTPKTGKGPIPTVGTYGEKHPRDEVAEIMDQVFGRSPEIEQSATNVPSKDSQGPKDVPERTQNPQTPGRFMDERQRLVLEPSVTVKSLGCRENAFASSHEELDYEYDSSSGSTSTPTQDAIPMLTHDEAPKSKPSGVPAVVSSCVHDGAPTGVPAGVHNKDPPSVPTCAHDKGPACVPTSVHDKVPACVPTCAPTRVHDSVPACVPSCVHNKITDGIPTCVHNRVPQGVPAYSQDRVPACVLDSVPTSVPSYVQGIVHGEDSALVQSTVSVGPNACVSASVQASKHALSTVTTNVLSTVPTVIPVTGCVAPKDNSGPHNPVSIKKKKAITKTSSLPDKFKEAPSIEVSFLQESRDQDDLDPGLDEIAPKAVYKRLVEKIKAKYEPIPELEKIDLRTPYQRAREEPKPKQVPLRINEAVKGRLQYLDLSLSKQAKAAKTSAFFQPHLKMTGVKNYQTSEAPNTVFTAGSNPLNAILEEFRTKFLPNSKVSFSLTEMEALFKMAFRQLEIWSFVTSAIDVIGDGLEDIKKYLAPEGNPLLEEYAAYMKCLDKAGHHAIGEASHLFSNLLLRKRELILDMAKKSVSPGQKAKLLFSPVSSFQLFDQDLVKETLKEINEENQAAAMANAARPRETLRPFYNPSPLLPPRGGGGRGGRSGRSARGSYKGRGPSAQTRAYWKRRDKNIRKARFYQ